MMPETGSDLREAAVRATATRNHKPTMLKILRAGCTEPHSTVTPLRTLSATKLAWATATWILVIDNQSFWRTLWAARDDSSLRGILALTGLALLLWLLFCLILRFLCLPRAAKPAVVLLLILSAVTASFVERYGIVIDRGMIRNVLQTDWREASDLIHGTLLLDTLLRGLLPAALVLGLRIEFARWRAAAVSIGLHALLLGALAATAFALFYADYAAAARNHRELRHLLTPTNVFNGLYGLWKEQRQASTVLEQIGKDARRDPAAIKARPLVVVLVVGETARAANFSLGGYPRPTNEALAGKQVVYFRNVTSCGTDTAISLPCMFSDLGRERFSLSAAASRENVLDVLKRAGVKVRWIENNSGCKGVCARVDTLDLSSTQDPALCDGRECLDGVLVRGLDQTIAGAATGDNLVVLHMKGSHGPAYYRRYPNSSRRFTPTCDTREIQRCSLEALRNTYDNGIAYTSEVLAQVIDMLAAHSGRIDSTLLYVSDHGESLGEQNVYLHGMPLLLAPREQTHVPMIAWLSPGASQRMSIDSAALHQAATLRWSHDNLGSTLLGLFEVRTSAYLPGQDILAGTRAIAPIHQTAPLQ